MTRRMLRNCSSSSFSSRMLGAACLAAGLLLLGAPLVNADQQGAVVRVADTQPGADSQPAGTVALSGTCVFGGNKSAWSAKLTPKGQNVYDAVYVCSWGGKPLAYKGTINTDLKTTISGNGTSTNKNGNGTFEFAGKFGADGTAQCPYKEVGGRRSGSLTVDTLK